jgi:Holliday junction resolvasome RuvABC endonuclease subunit
MVLENKAAGTFVGIDPGLDGYIVAVRGSAVTAWVVPTTQGKASKRDIDIRELVRTLETILEESRICMAVVERQQAMPSQGSASGFKTGMGFGILLGILATMGVPHEIVSSVTWKKAMGLTSAGTTKEEKRAHTKQQSIQTAQRLFPVVDLRASSRCKIPHDGKAEALLLAEYARRRFNGK